jgi:hypothetical protein
MPFGIIPDSAFGFAGIPNHVASGVETVPEGPKNPLARVSEVFKIILH